MTIKEKIEEVTKEVLKYYEMTFDSKEEDYFHNKFTKEKFGDLIKESNDETETNEVLIALAQLTGCAEDQEIAEEVLEDLYNNGFITNKQFEIFYENTSTRRWL